MNTHARTLLCSCTLIVIIAGHSALAASGSWSTDADGNWSDAANWAGGVIADGAGETAYFDAIAITNDRTVTVDTPRTIGSLAFTQPGTWWSNFYLRGGALTLENTDGVAVIAYTNGRPRIYCPLAGTNALMLMGTGQVGSTPGAVMIFSTNLNLGPIFVNSRVVPGNSWALGTNAIFLNGGNINNLSGTMIISNRIVILANWTNDGAKEMRGPVEFRVNHTLTAWGNVDFNCPISGDGSFIKGGNEWGQITYRGAQPNTYTNVTILDTRGLTLQKSSNVVALAGNVIVGRPGTTPANTSLTLNAHDQISDNAEVILGESKVNAGVNRGPIFVVGAFQDTIGALRSTNREARVSINGGHLTFGANGNAASYAGKFVGRGLATKTGAGTFTLAQGSDGTLTGVLTVAQGTLEVNGSFWATNTVVAQDAILKGSGIVSSDFVVASSGTLAPGTSAGAITIAGNAALMDAAQLELEWNDGVANDAIVVEGSFTAYGSPVIKVVNIGGPPAGATQVVLNVTGTYTGPAGGYTFDLPVFWSAVHNGSGDLIDLGGGAYGLAFIPEPGMLAGGAALVLLAARRRLRAAV